MAKILLTLPILILTISLKAQLRHPKGMQQIESESINSSKKHTIKHQSINYLSPKLLTIAGAGREFDQLNIALKFNSHLNSFKIIIEWLFGASIFILMFWLVSLSTFSKRKLTLPKHDGMPVHSFLWNHKCGCYRSGTYTNINSITTK